MTPGETGFSSYWCVHSAGAEENQGFRNKYKEKIFIMIAFFNITHPVLVLCSSWCCQCSLLTNKSLISRTLAVSMVHKCVCFCVFFCMFYILKWVGFMWPVDVQGCNVLLQTLGESHVIPHLQQ